MTTQPEPKHLDTTPVKAIIKFMRTVKKNDVSRLAKYSLGFNAGFERCKHMIAHCDEMHGRPSFATDIDTLTAEEFNTKYQIGATNLVDEVEVPESVNKHAESSPE